MHTKLTALMLGWTITATATAAQSEIQILTPACEEALALSAGPAHLRDAAGVMVLTDAGYETVRGGTNGYMCMVERDSDLSIIPQCFDKAGQVSHVPVHTDAAAMARSGSSWEEITQARADGFASGKYTRAAGPGVVYMASDYNLVVSPDGREKVKIWPHVMYHAPDVTNDDIGADFMQAMQNPGMPFIAGEGPLGFMISFIDQATDSSDVVTHCDGQLPDIADFKPLPPRTY